VVVRVTVGLVAGIFLLAPAAPAVAKPPGRRWWWRGRLASTLFAKAYSNIVNGSQLQFTPEDVQVTSAGGYAALGATNPAGSGASVGWLLKLSSTGSPQSQLEVGCLSGAPGDYSIGSSLALTSDGGEVLGGGTIGCGSGNNCPTFSGIQCALVEKVSATGGLEWARVYNAAANGSAIRKIRQTRDGGLIAAGTILGAGQVPGGLVLKLDGLGNVQWERRLGPAGSTQVLPNDVPQTPTAGTSSPATSRPHAEARWSSNWTPAGTLCGSGATADRARPAARTRSSRAPTAAFWSAVAGMTP
jgi:hypothetical protein